MKLIILEDRYIKKHMIDSAIVDLALVTVSFSSIHDIVKHIQDNVTPFILISEIISSSDLSLSQMSKALQLDHFKGMIFLSRFSDDIIEMGRHISRSLDFSNVHALALPTTATQIRDKITRVIGSKTIAFADKYAAKELNISVINEALVNDLFEPYFQAQVCSKSHKVHGFEILARLNKDNIIYSPDRFIDPLIKAQRITEFTFLMLKKTLTILSQEKTFTRNISLNIDYQSLCHYDFAKNLLGILKAFNFPAAQFTVEITENKPLINTYVMHNLTLFRMSGCELSIDDFGTKSSGFTELLKFPFTQIKIDKIFIRDMLDSSRAYKVVKAICAVAQSLDCDVVAEGVETEQQRDILQQLDVCYIQGYLYSKPLPIEDAIIEFPE